MKNRYFKNHKLIYYLDWNDGGMWSLVVSLGEAKA